MGNDGAVTGLKGASSCLLVTLFLWFGSEAQGPKPGFAPKGWTGGGAGGNRVDGRGSRREQGGQEVGPEGWHLRTRVSGDHGGAQGSDRRGRQ